MERLNLQTILCAFNNPLNEEQAWAICYKCARFLQDQWKQSPAECFRFGGLHAVELGRDGSVLAVRGADELAGSEYEITQISQALSQRPVVPLVERVLGKSQQLVQSLGVVVFQALDYGLSDTEEQKLSPALEQLIEQMTGSDSDDDATDTKIDKHGDDASLVDDADDEGIEHDAEDGDIDNDDIAQPHGLSLTGVIELCRSHCQVSTDVADHYKAVCRALFAEAKELSTFLEKISSDKVHLKMDVNEAEEGANLEELKQADWARLWMQVMRQLRHGVKLKKLEHLELEQPREFELTPYEMLMEDISSRRYTLNKVLVNGDLPPRTKKDAHAVILDFIRSRPPLHPMKDRKLAPPPPKEQLPRDLMLEDIRSEPRLNPTPGRHNILSRLDEEDGSPAKVKKVIRPDPSLFTFDEVLADSVYPIDYNTRSSQDDDEEEEEEDEDMEADDNAAPDKNRVEPLSPMSPFSPLSPRTPPLEGEATPKQKAAVKQPQTAKPHHVAKQPHHVARQCEVAKKPEQRHSVTLCKDSWLPPQWPLYENQLQSSLECLSLTVDEVMHIRRVLTKAELESLLVDLPMHELVARAKICFTCKKTRFSLFQWSTKCAFCGRYVCSKCVSKMHIPTEHFEHIPVYTLSPSPSSPDSNPDLFMFQKTGSVPSSPKSRRSSTDMILSVSSIDNGVTSINQNGCTSKRGFGAGGSGISNHGRPFRAPMQRAQTVVQRDASPIPTSMVPRALRGPMKRICRDCKAMIVNIIRASRFSLATAPSLAADKTYVNQPSPRKASRNFHLDLKPVYRTTPRK